MTDPIDGVLGQLLMGGWIGETPDGGEAAYLSLSTPGTKAHPAEETMPVVAQSIGLDAVGGRMRNADPTVVLDITADNWVALRIAGQDVGTRPMTPEWVEHARARGYVVLAVLYIPARPDVAVDDAVDEAVERGLFAAGKVTVRYTES